MATKTVKFDKAGVETIIKGIARPVEAGKPFFDTLALLVDRQTQMTFRLNGARPGSSKWTGLSINTIQTKNGTSRIRYGTDGTPKKRKRGTFTPFVLRKGVRRYGGEFDNIFQASGLFKKSFKKTLTTDHGMLYETNHKWAKSIMGGNKTVKKPLRNVLFITPTDIQIYQKKYRDFIDKGIKF